VQFYFRPRVILFAFVLFFNVVTLILTCIMSNYTFHTNKKIKKLKLFFFKSS